MDADRSRSQSLYVLMMCVLITSNTACMTGLDEKPPTSSTPPPVMVDEDVDMMDGNDVDMANTIDMESADMGAPDMLEEPAPVKRVHAGNGHNCVITDVGGVKCWGWNSEGQLGNGTEENANEPVEVSGLSEGVIALSAGHLHTCAVMGSGGVKCWGDNSYGQLGVSAVRSTTPKDVAGLGARIVAVSAGRFHTCALSDVGGVICWGWNKHGQLGNGRFASREEPTVTLGMSSGVSIVSAGGYHTCALMNSGGVKCWGYNATGHLGNGSNRESPVPAGVTGLSSGVTSLTVGQNHACALLDTGGVKCWGDNLFDQLGSGENRDAYTPVDVSNLTTGVTSISAGWGHTCAVQETGGLICWGENGNGQLGDGTSNDSPVPIQVVDLGSEVSFVSAGGDHTCADTTAGDVMCWGGNRSGQLATGDFMVSGMPQKAY